VAGRYYAARIYYHHGSGKPVKTTLAEARRYLQSLQQYRPVNLQESFEFPVIEALVLTGEVEEAHFYLQAAAPFAGKHKEEADPWLSIYHLLEAFVLHELKLITDLSQRLLQYNVDHYPVFARKYAALLYKALMNRMLKSGRRSREQLSSMIDATGFRRFAHLYAEQ
jgi:hypothetical protein